MSTLNQAIGLLGGTFDPIHFGHLRMAIELGATFNLAKIHVIPCYQPVHRQLPVASATERLAMVEYAVANETMLCADGCEVARQSPSYTIETLLALRAEQPETPLCLLLGIDAFLGFPSWHRAQDILSLAHLIIAHRPPYELPKSGAIADLLYGRLQQDIVFIQHHLAGGILFHPITALEISASDIRKQIAMGGNPRYLLPDAVFDYIQQQGIYHPTGPIEKR